MNPLEILSATGKDRLPDDWKISKIGSIEKVFDYQARTYVYKLCGLPSTSCRMTSPTQTFGSLKLEHAYVALQICVPPRKDFSFEIEANTGHNDISQDRRKLVFSTYQSCFMVNGTTAKWTLHSGIRGQWCNIVVPVRELVSEAWPADNFMWLRSISVCANCSIRRLFLIKALPDIAVEDYDCGVMKLDWIPKHLQLRSGVLCPSYIISHVFLCASSQRNNLYGDKPDTNLHRPRQLPSLLAQGNALLPSKIVANRPQAASAPSRPNRGDFTNLRNRKCASAGFQASKRWTSLPRLSSNRKDERNVDKFNGGFREVKQAWRGPSAKLGAARTPIDREESVEIVLARRIEELLGGPDEDVQFECSDVEETDADQQNEQTAIEIAEVRPCPPVYMDSEEAEMLASLQKLSRKYSLNSSLNSEHHPLSPTQLKKHEFDDESDDECYANNGPPVLRVSPAGDVLLHKLEESQNSYSSLKSARIRHKNLETSGHWWKEDSSIASDSGLEEVCTSLDLIFDPQLNCYYHPTTQQYFSVSS